MQQLSKNKKADGFNSVQSEITFASLFPLEEQMSCQMIKTYGEFPHYLEQRLANDTCKGLCFRFSRPYGLCHNCSAMQLQCENNHR